MQPPGQWANRDLHGTGSIQPNDASGSFMMFTVSMNGESDLATPADDEGESGHGDAQQGSSDRQARDSGARRHSANTWEAIYPKDNLRVATAPILEQQTDVIRQAMEPIREQQTKVIRQAMEPILEQHTKVIRQAMEPILEQTLEPIRNGIVQSALTPLANIEIQALKDASDSAKRLSERWLRELDQASEADLRDLLPPNLRVVYGQVRPRQLVRLVRDDGIPVYWSLAPDVAKELVRTRNPDERREILSDRWEPSADQCQQILQDCGGSAALEFVGYVQEGIAALRTGHVSAAQSLFTTCLDLLAFRLAGHDDSLLEFKKRHVKGAEHPYPLGAGVETKVWVWLPVWHAHEGFNQRVRRPVPAEYNRHATVHAISPEQYNRANAVIAMMLVTSLVAYAEWELSDGAA